MSQERASEELVSFEAEGTGNRISSEPPWQLLVVDDEHDIHKVTRLALSDFQFDRRGLEILSAHSAAEARALLSDHPDIALILLDVVMETDRAGLDLVHHVRKTLKNPFVRIVLRTGQPGRAPERQIIIEYDINDYKSKGELTATRLFTLVYTGLSSYRDLKELHEIRQLLSRRTQELAAANGELERFATMVAADIEAPMRNIAGLSGLIRRRLAAETGEASEWLQALADNIRRIQSVANELKDYANSSASSGRQNVEVESVLNLALCDLNEDIVRSGASIQHGSLPAIYSHPGDLLRVFQNLIAAAIRHGGEHPEVVVDAERQEGRWVFCLTGIIGTPAAGAKPRPDADEAEPSAARPDFKELSVCRRIVERHGGRLWITAGEQSTRICFTLSG